MKTLFIIHNSLFIVHKAPKLKFMRTFAFASITKFYSLDETDRIGKKIQYAFKIKIFPFILIIVKKKFLKALQVCSGSNPLPTVFQTCPPLT